MRSGIARAAIDALLDLAERKTPTRSTSVLRELPLMQANLAQAEGLVQAARAFMWQMTAEVWDRAAARGDPVTLRHRALLRLGMTHAVQSAAQAVDLVWAAAGASPVYTRSPLERCFRDIHVATQHAAVGTVQPGDDRRRADHCRRSKAFWRFADLASAADACDCDSTWRWPGVAGGAS